MYGKGIMKDECRFEEELSSVEVRAGLVRHTGEKSEVIDKIPTVGSTDNCSWNRRPIPSDEGPLTEWVGAKGERVWRGWTWHLISQRVIMTRRRGSKCVQDDVQ